MFIFIFFFNDTATTEIYTLSLHDALPIYPALTMREKVTELTRGDNCMGCHAVINPLGFSLENFDAVGRFRTTDNNKPVDRKSTRLNSSHANISYAVFCLKKTKKSSIIRIL